MSEGILHRLSNGMRFIDEAMHVAFAVTSRGLYHKLSLPEFDALRRFPCFVNLCYNNAFISCWFSVSLLLFPHWWTIRTLYKSPFLGSNIGKNCTSFD